MAEQFNEQQLVVLRKMADALIFQQSAGYVVGAAPTQMTSTLGQSVTVSTADPEGLVEKLQWKTTKSNGTPSKFPWTFANSSPEAMAIAAICKTKNRNTLWLSTNHIAMSDDGKFLTKFPNKKVTAEADK